MRKQPWIGSVMLIGLSVVLAACSAAGGPAAQPTETLEPISFVESAAVPQMDKVPQAQAIEALKKQGRDAKETYFSSPEDAVQAVARGDAQFGSAAAATVMAATAQGVGIKAIMQANSNPYVMVAPTSVSSPAGLTDMRIGIHSPVSQTALVTNIMLNEYPDVKAKIVVVPGSEARVQALGAGQLDASAISLADIASLEKLAPGKFHVIYDFSAKYPELYASLLFTRTELLTSNPKLVEAFLKANIQAQRAAYSDKDALAAAATALLPNTDAARGKELAKLFTDAKVYTTDGGMSPSSVDFNIKVLADNGLLKQVPTAQQCCDRAPLDAALAALK